MGASGNTEKPHWTSIALGSLAVVVSGIAIWASIQSVGASNEASEKVAAFEAGAETDRSRAEFLREQRQIAYADFLTKEDLVYKLESQLADNLALRNDPGWTEQESTAWNDMNLSLNTVRIVGSDDSIDAANALIRCYKDNPIGVVAPAPGTPGSSAPPPTVDPTSVSLGWSSIQPNFQDLRDEFIAVAQHDIRGG